MPQKSSFETDLSNYKAADPSPDSDRSEYSRTMQFQALDMLPAHEIQREMTLGDLVSVMDEEDMSDLYWFFNRSLNKFTKCEKEKPFPEDKKSCDKIGAGTYRYMSKSQMIVPGWFYLIIIHLIIYGGGILTWWDIKKAEKEIIKKQKEIDLVKHQRMLVQERNKLQKAKEGKPVSDSKPKKKSKKGSKKAKK